MKKRVFSVMSVLCPALLTALGITGCKSQQNVTQNNTPRTYGPQTIIIKERVDTVVKERVKTVYGAPVVRVDGPDWRSAIPDEEGVYDVAEVMPQFPGGEAAMDKWIDKHLIYPEEARQEGVKGRVMVSFTVLTDGSLDGVTVLRPIHPLLDAEAVRLVQAMPKWKPGTMRGEAVPVRYFIPVKF
jgi:TonB family protein